MVFILTYLNNYLLTYGGNTGSDRSDRINYAATNNLKDYCVSDTSGVQKVCDPRAVGGAVRTILCYFFFFSWHTLLERCRVHHWSPVFPTGCLLPCILSGFRSASVARSQAWLGLPIGRFQSELRIGSFWIAAVTERWWASAGGQRTMWPKRCNFLSVM